MGAKKGSLGTAARRTLAEGEILGQKLPTLLQ
jgi:hypothetical protein